MSKSRSKLIVRTKSLIIMDKELESSSFLNLLRSDSGVALTSMDAMVRETELQQRQLDIEDKEIEDIRERLEHLEDVVQNCEFT